MSPRHESRMPEAMAHMCPTHSADASSVPVGGLNAAKPGRSEFRRDEIRHSPAIERPEVEMHDRHRSGFLVFRANVCSTPGVFGDKPVLWRRTMRTARVIAVDRDLYTVRPAGGEGIHAKLSGRFRNQAEDVTRLPCAGDRVAVEISADAGVIHDVLPRDTVLRRKRPGKGLRNSTMRSNQV